MTYARSPPGGCLFRFSRGLRHFDWSKSFSWTRLHHFNSSSSTLVGPNGPTRHLGYCTQEYPLCVCSLCVAPLWCASASVSDLITSVFGTLWTPGGPQPSPSFPGGNLGGVLRAGTATDLNPEHRRSCTLSFKDDNIRGVTHRQTTGPFGYTSE